MLDHRRGAGGLSRRVGARRGHARVVGRAPRCAAHPTGRSTSPAAARGELAAGKRGYECASRVGRRSAVPAYPPHPPGGRRRPGIRTSPRARPPQRALPPYGCAGLEGLGDPAVDDAETPPEFRAETAYGPAPRARRQYVRVGVQGPVRLLGWPPGMFVIGHDRVERTWQFTSADGSWLPAPTSRS